MKKAILIGYFAISSVYSAHCNYNLRDKAIAVLVPNLSNSILDLVDPKTDLMNHLELGSALGTGMKATVYDISSLNLSPKEQSIYQDNIKKYGKLVVKFPHTLRLSRGILRFTPPALHTKEDTLDRESRIFSFLQKKENKIKLANVVDDYVKDRYWRVFKLPLTPIVQTINTPRGSLLVKPKVSGKSLKNLAKIGELTLDQKNSLKEIFRLNLALGENFVHEGLNFYIDINPTNLVWIEDPKEMEKFGLFKPGFFLYELTVHKSHRRKTRENMTEDQYVELFEKAMKDS